MEGGLALPNGLCHSSLLKELNLLGSSPNSNLFYATNNINNNTIPAFNSAEIDAINNTQTAPNNTSAPTNANPFSISDYLVPGLQTKVWEDWQGADDLQDYTVLCVSLIPTNPLLSVFLHFGPSSSNTFETQDYVSDLNSMPFQFGLENMLGNTPIWDNNAIPADQAYDEFVFELAPTSFETPTTVNIADLIVGPSSNNNTSVSPLDLTTTAASTYQDLALAHLYGFNDNSYDSDSGSDLDEVDFSDSEDEEEVEEKYTTPKAEIEAIAAQEPVVIVEQQQLQVVKGHVSVNVVPRNVPATPAVVKCDDPNKRRMVEVLVDRINNDLGEDDMPGLFKILSGSDDGADEMEVDFSSLDESTLVQVYQYVESCCMQTMGAILAAEERDRAAVTAAQAAQAAAAAEQEAALERQVRYMERTPELSPSYSSASSISPSPPHPSSIPSPSSKSKRGPKKRRTPSYNEDEIYAQEAHFPISATTTGAEATSTEYASKGKRKRANNGGLHGIGGGGTGKGRRIQKDQHQPQAVLPVVGQTVVMEDEMEYGEDTEIDIVGI
ncbi:hypothetical protein BGZ83_005893 [Gryganskiella cystojenkinii]|nr:hypothetical protein BGZ83_005893 [Gryganskiella cystojenkinii]